MEELLEFGDGLGDVRFWVERRGLVEDTLFAVSQSFSAFAGGSSSPILRAVCESYSSCI